MDNIQWIIPITVLPGIDLKMFQLKRLNWSLVLITAIVILIIYGFRSIYIRQRHLKI